MNGFAQRLSPKTRDALLQAIERFSDLESSSSGVVASGTTSARKSPSRQARHARLVRARSLGVAGVAVLAAGHDEFADALLAPDFGTLRPLSADVHRRAWYILNSHQGISAEGAGRLFERSQSLLFDLAPRLAACSRNEILRVQGAMTGIFLGCIVLPDAFVAAWDDLWSEANQRGLLRNKYFHLQLTLAGSYVGRCAPHLDWLLDPRVRDFDATDDYLFVRRDDSEELLDLTARAIRGEDVKPEDALLPSNPASTIKLLASYARTCMRDPSHFSNEGQTLMVLQWVDEVWTRMRALAEAGLGREDIRRLQEELRKVERVQSIENGRFWRTVETATPAARAELLRLWTRTFEML